MSTEENKASVRKAYEVVNQQNLSSFIVEFIDPNQVDHSAPPGLPGGVEGARQLAAMFLTAFPDLHFRVEDMIAEGEQGGGPHYHERNAARCLYGHPPNRQARDVDDHRHQPRREWQERRALDGDGRARSDATTRRCPRARTDQLVAW